MIRIITRSFFALFILMKSIRIFIPLIFSVFGGNPALAAVIWQQEFNSGSDLESDYIGEGANQFDAVTSSGAGLTWAILDGALQATRSGNAGSLTISGDDFAAQVLLVEMRLQISTVASPATTSIMFAVGSAFDHKNTHPNNDVTHSDFSINLNSDVPDSFRFRDHDGETNLGNTEEGTDAIATGQWVDLWWGINNSGADLSYTRPDGSTTTLQDDRWDLWAKVNGTWHLIGNNPSNANNAGDTLDDFKVTFTRGEGTLLLDSIRLSNAIGIVPEPSGILLAAAGSVVLPLNRRRQGQGTRRTA
jgi:hypothetical protein